MVGRMVFRIEPARCRFARGPIRRGGPNHLHRERRERFQSADQPGRRRHHRSRCTRTIPSTSRTAGLDDQ